MKNQYKFVLAAATLGLGLSVQAADWYVGGSVGQSDFKEDVGAVPAGITVDKKDTGYKLFVGAGLHPNFAVELGYVDHGKLNVSGGGQSAGIKAQGYFLDAVGRLPLDNNFGVFAKVGVFNGKVKTYGAGALGFADESDSGTDMKYGLGVSYSMTKNIAVRGEWERYRYKAFDEKSDVDLLSIGLSYSF